jgi:hypothetical protein
MITPLFSVSQTIGEPTKINFQDDSTGVDTQSIVKRRIYPTDKNGDEVVVAGTTVAYEEWNSYPGTTTITLALLPTQDLALDLRVDWLNASNVVQQTLTLRRDFTLYAVTYFIFLIKSLANNPKLKYSANFWPKTIELLGYIKMADDAILLLNDISASQAALGRAKLLIDAPSNFF